MSRLFASALALAVALASAACTRETPAEATAPAPAPTTVPLAPPPPLGRADLLAAVAQAASAAAAGAPAPEAATGLAGRRFSLRLPFGCAGPQSDAWAGFEYDAGRETLRLSARPETWTDQPWVRTLVATDGTEAIEGFWIRRPWMLMEGCPAVAPLADAAQGDETLGLVQVFDADGSRLARRSGRAYQATEKMSAEPRPGQGGFRLALEGRVAATELRGPIRCLAASADQRPVCLVMVEIDRVAFEDASGRRIAEWTS
jgi:hypothetical protein